MMATQDDHNQHVYDDAFYRAQKDGSYLAARRVLPYVLSLLPTVANAADFGCGAGGWLKALEALGVPEIQGVDFGDNSRQLFIRPEQYRQHDLTRPIDLRRRYDLVMSLEVAEHLPPESAATFVRTLCLHGGVVLFSAAIPGQGGVAHVNEQWQSYWQRLFADCHYRLLDLVRPRFWGDSQIPFWYRQNMVLFVVERRTALLDKLGRLGKPLLIDVVHPEAFLLARAWQNRLYQEVLRLQGQQETAGRASP